MIEVTIDATDLNKWSAYFSNIPKQTKAGLARALNKVGEGTAHGAAQFIANQANLDVNAVYQKIAITQATPDSLEWSMDASAISPPSLDWSRPWGERDSNATFDQDTMVKVVTMDDENVCEKCQQAAIDSPYTLKEVYQIRHDTGGDGCLIHQNCRCGLAPWSSLRKIPVVFNRPGDDIPSGLFTPNQLGEAVADEMKVTLFVTGR
jgi:hypothetical protein